MTLMHWIGSLQYGISSTGSVFSGLKCFLNWFISKMELYIILQHAWGLPINHVSIAVDFQLYFTLKSRHLFVLCGYVFCSTPFSARKIAVRCRQPKQLLQVKSKNSSQNQAFVKSHKTSWVNESIVVFIVGQSSKSSLLCQQNQLCLNSRRKN